MIIVAIISFIFTVLFLIKAIQSFRCVEKAEAILDHTTMRTYHDSEQQNSRDQYTGYYCFQVPGYNEKFEYISPVTKSDSSKLPTTLTVYYAPSDPEICCSNAGRVRYFLGTLIGLAFTIFFCTGVFGIC